MPKQERRFIVVHEEGSALSGSQIQIFVDRYTGVNYLYRQTGYAGGLTVLLDGEGKPVITKYEVFDDDIGQGV